MLPYSFFIVDFLSSCFALKNIVDEFSPSHTVHFKNVHDLSILKSFLSRHPPSFPIEQIILSFNEKAHAPADCIGLILYWIEKSKTPIQLEINFNFISEIYTQPNLIKHIPKNLKDLRFKGISKPQSPFPVNLFSNLPNKLPSLTLSHLQLGPVLLDILTVIPKGITSLAVDGNDVSGFSAQNLALFFSLVPKQLESLQIDNDIIIQHSRAMNHCLPKHLKKLIIVHAQVLAEDPVKRQSLISCIPQHIHSIYLDHHLLFRPPFKLTAQMISPLSHSIYVDLTYVGLSSSHLFLKNIPKHIDNLFFIVPDAKLRYMSSESLQRYLYKHYSCFKSVTVNQNVFNIQELKQELELRYCQLFLTLQQYNDTHLHTLLMTVQKLNPSQALEITLLEFLEATLSIFQKPSKAKIYHYLETAKQLPYSGSRIWQVIGGFFMIMGVMMLISNLSLFLLHSLINLSFGVELMGLMIALIGYVIFQIAAPQELAQSALTLGRALGAETQT